MKNCFPCFSCFKKKKKIVIPDRVTEPEVKIQQQDVRRRPINIQKASKPPNDGASSTNGTVPQNNRFLEQAKGVGAGAAVAAVQVKDISVAAAGQVKVISAGAVEQARVISKGAFNLLPNSIQGYFGKKNDMKDHNRVVRLHHWKKDEMEQNKIRQEKEEENRRQQDLAEEKRRQNKIRQEKEEEDRRRQGSENNSGGTSKVAEITESLLTAMSSTLAYASSKALGTEQPSTSAETQRTRRPRTTQNPTQKETRPVEKKGKKGR